MALNSYITADGMEMGRAQVMQAEAAGIAPDVRMNPILLKPTSDSGSQVIVNGEIYGTMRAQEYYTKKQELIPYILKAYHALAAENDIIVLEGAGSPAEINLKSVDIVNLGMAELSDSPAILVGILTAAACLHHFMVRSCCWTMRNAAGFRVLSSTNSAEMWKS